MKHFVAEVLLGSAGCLQKMSNLNVLAWPSVSFAPVLCSHPPRFRKCWPERDFAKQNYQKTQNFEELFNVNVRYVTLNSDCSKLSKADNKKVIQKS